jgi:hypothetical protein
MSGREFYLWQVGSFKVRLALDFVDTLTQDLAKLNPAEEQGGLLLGRIIDNDNVEVTGCEFIRSEHHRGVSYDLSGHERYVVDRRVRTLSKHRRGPIAVGYFRTHLRPGLFLDQSDFALMSDSFADIPAIALAIRTDRPGPPNAGIFFWEYGDIDRKQPQLTFPFDAATLRVQGPIEQEALTPERTSRLKALPPSLVWGAVAALSVFAMSAEFRHAEHPSAIVRIPPIEQLPIYSALPQFEPIAVEELRDVGAPEPAPEPVLRQIQLPLKPKPTPIAATPVVPPVVPPPTVAPAAPLVASIPPPPPVRASAPQTKNIAVDVTLEPRTPSEIKRITRHLLHAFHSEGGGVTPARPNASLSPRLSPELTRSLSGEVNVDVVASLDKQGVVKNAEVTRGAGTELGMLAANTARSVPWDPARSGDRNVAMEVVVHYRFNPRE